LRNVSEYFVNRNKVLSTNHNSLYQLPLPQRDVSKMEVNQTPYEISIAENKDRAEATLARLKSLRNRVAEIREQVEALRKLQTEKPKKTAVCFECGKEIQKDQEVTIKDSTGNPTSYYHRDCFKAIWSSQNWRFDYSSPGFLSKPE
jgi:uncharacterized protein with PIN domain